MISGGYNVKRVHAAWNAIRWVVEANKELRSDTLTFATCLVAANAVLTAFPIALFMRLELVFINCLSSFAQRLRGDTFLQIWLRLGNFRVDKVPELVFNRAVMDYSIVSYGLSVIS